jgi:hypothetical protein
LAAKDERRVEHIIFILGANFALRENFQSLTSARFNQDFSVINAHMYLPTYLTYLHTYITQTKLKSIKVADGRKTYFCEEKCNFDGSMYTLSRYRDIGANSSVARLQHPKKSKFGYISEWKMFCTF